MSKRTKRPLRIGIIHDDFSLCGGGEKLVTILAKALSEKGMQADIITYNIAEETKKIIAEGVTIKTILNKPYPFHDHIVKKYLFSTLNLGRRYDLFLFSGYFCLYAAERHKPNILYWHNVEQPSLPPDKTFEEAPSKEQLGAKSDLLNQLDNSALGKTWSFLHTVKNIFIKKKIPKRISKNLELVRFLFSISPHPVLLKYITDPITVQENIGNELKHIQNIIVNSHTTQKDAQTLYNRDATIIYPPVETEKFRYKQHKNFWVSINRIDPHKQIELQLEAFAQLPNEKLYVIGHIQNQKYYEFLKNIKPANVEFLGVLNETGLIEKLSECKGMVFTAKKEDFGMAPVEAMASGKPVIAPNEGGCRETIIDGKTGILIDNINAAKLAAAVKALNKYLKKNPEQYKDACMKQAKQFDVKVFVEHMEKEIRNALV